MRVGSSIVVVAEPTAEAKLLVDISEDNMQLGILCKQCDRTDPLCHSVSRPPIVGCGAFHCGPPVNGILASSACSVNPIKAASDRPLHPNRYLRLRAQKDLTKDQAAYKYEKDMTAITSRVDDVPDMVVYPELCDGTVGSQ